MEENLETKLEKAMKIVENKPDISISEEYVIKAKKSSSIKKKLKLYKRAYEANPQNKKLLEMIKLYEGQKDVKRNLPSLPAFKNISAKFKENYSGIKNKAVYALKAGSVGAIGYILYAGPHSNFMVPLANNFVNDISELITAREFDMRHIVQNQIIGMTAGLMQGAFTGISIASSLLILNKNKRKINESYLIKWHGVTGAQGGMIGGCAGAVFFGGDGLLVGTYAGMVANYAHSFLAARKGN